MGWLQERDVGRDKRQIGKRTLSDLPKAGRQPSLPATAVARGKPRLPWTLLPLHLDQPRSTSPSLLWTLSDQHLVLLRSTTPSPALILSAPPQQTMLRLSSTSSRRLLTSSPGVEGRTKPFHFFIFSSLRHQRQERSIVVEACPL